jgi:hypothetical protein
MSSPEKKKYIAKIYKLRGNENKNSFNKEK